MAERLKRNLDFIKVLANAKPRQRKAIVHTADKDLILCLCEIILNLLTGNVKVPDKIIDQLRKHKDCLRTLAEQRTSLKTRRDILEQKGGFLPILLTPILSIAGQLLADLVTKK